MRTREPRERAWSTARLHIMLRAARRWLPPSPEVISSIRANFSAYLFTHTHTHARRGGNGTPTRPRRCVGVCMASDHAQTTIRHLARHVVPLAMPLAYPVSTTISPPPSALFIFYTADVARNNRMRIARCYPILQIEPSVSERLGTLGPGGWATIE